MANKSIHDRVSRFIARKKGTTYNPGKGVDIPGPRQAIEVEKDPGKIGEAIRQLQGYKIPRYVAGTNKKVVKAALERTKNTSVGVMNQKGEIVKRAGKH